MLRKKNLLLWKGLGKTHWFFCMVHQDAFCTTMLEVFRFDREASFCSRTFPGLLRTQKNHAYRGLGYEVLINCLEYNLNRVLPVLYLHWLCPSSGHRKTFPAISPTARSWTKTGGRLSPMFFLPLKPRYQRVESQQEMGPRVDGECLNRHLENLGICSFHCALFLSLHNIVFSQLPKSSTIPRRWGNGIAYLFQTMKYGKEEIK